MVSMVFTNIVRPRGEGPFRCPCCGNVTLDERGGGNLPRLLLGG
jgi:hypothetical protein